MAEREPRRQRQERIREERRRLQQSRGRQRWQKGVVAVGAALVIATGAGIGIHQYLQSQEQVEVVSPGLGLRIDEAEFWNVIKRGYAYGFVPETDRKDQMYCPPWAPGICMAESSPNFTLAVNGFMAEFMFKQTSAVNPVVPIKMIFIEDWWKTDEGYVSGSTAILEDEIHVITSLKMEAFRAFKIMEKENTLTTQDTLNHFRGNLSLLISRTAAHELVHAGAETKKFGLLRDKKLTDILHPQVYDFEEKYDQLIREAAKRTTHEHGLIFGAEPRQNLNLLAYRVQINREAQERGIR